MHDHDTKQFCVILSINTHQINGNVFQFQILINISKGNVYKCYVFAQYKCFKVQRFGWILIDIYYWLLLIDFFAWFGEWNFHKINNFITERCQITKYVANSSHVRER